MGKLLCEKNLRDVWCRNEGVRAEIGQMLHTHASPIVVFMLPTKDNIRALLLQSAIPVDNL